MPTNTIDQFTFEVNDEGFLTDRNQWSKELCEVWAELVGIEHLTPEHWATIEFMRDDSAKSGVTPTLRRMQTVGGFDVRELYQLFPGKPVKKMAYLSGLPKPVGCV